MSPPFVMTVSPRRTFLTISWCCFTRFCCGRKIRKYMMTKMSAKGSSDISMPPSPPTPPSPCANAGVINIEARSSVVFPAPLAAQFGADYSGRGPNCTAVSALKPPHFQRFPRGGAGGRTLAPLRAIATLRKHLMARSKAKPPPRPAPKPKGGGPPDGRPETLERIAVALERLAPERTALLDLSAADAFIWHPDGRLSPVARVNRVEMSLLKGIDRVRDVLVENTERFAKGLPANNALLWGARGMGKSSLVKAAHAGVNAAVRRSSRNGLLKLIEIHREDIDSLPSLMALTRGSPHRFIVFCDDLSFDVEDTTYKSLKAVLEGGIEGRPDNVIFYATSNRRHMM